ncbi:MAG TPA: SRPBCC domain-containing protein [Chloroflexia bacterium]|nr:SRPBCC domain-containing protein [Chloroflexia bacterium]
MGNLELERGTWIAAPRERVWQAITDPEQLQQWFLPPALGASMTRDAGGTLSVGLGPMKANVAVLEAMEPPTQVTMLGLPDRLIAITYTLEEENGGTRVRVVLHGGDSLSGDAARERLAPSGEAWEMALANLKAYVEGQELPYPYASQAAIYGYRRETKEKFSIERSIWIAAPRERVWQAITDPDQIDKWFSPGTKWGGTGLEVGGRMFVLDPETGAEMYTQVIEAVEPPHRLVTSSVPEPPETVHVTTWRLEEENGGTRLVLTHSGYELEPVETRAINMEQNAFGFGMMLENLAASIEGKELPFPQGF